ncbi:Fic family protein [Nocardiopsis sp. FIRDI 009]|uniref:Fic family protein n=1 Tax=Nocardiopsis sp. FIRDI 009 TaxID=714197 RepID=UPI000E26F90A|nr:Fic family protein [Nocardiopsis sp. FIRDI 009]
MTVPPDHLRRWLTVREGVDWHAVRPVEIPTAGPIVPARDGAVHDIRTRDHARSPDRAAGLLDALDLARADATAGRVLTFDLLSAWQCRVLGVAHAPFRRGPAYAKGGRERYGIGPDLRDRFDTCLAQNGDTSLPLSSRAARAYLDVCFFHPFDDGNGRSAFLALDFVLARSGIVLDQVAPVRALRRWADDPEGALALADLVSVLTAHTLRRCAHG